MVSSTQPVAFPGPRQPSERLIWALGGLVLVITATFSAMAAPGLAQAQQWPFVASQRPEAASTPAALLEEQPAPPAVTTSLETPAPLPARTGTVLGEGDEAFLAALLEASALNVEVSPAPVAAAAPEPTVAPAAAPASAPTADARPAATPVATAAPTAVPTPVASVSNPPAPLATYSERAAGLFLAMNEERVAAGLTPLVASAAASEIAMHRALDMQQNDYFAHVSPTGENWLQLVNEAGIELTAGGENLAKISGDVERSVTVAITKLMESPTHAANILGVYYDSVGVAAVTDERGVTIFVTIFLG
jgi:uncharacterized protein YkwD